MELYILKSAACLIILFSFYKVFLEKETMHTFKRFYLLGSVVISIIIPWITFTSYIEVPKAITKIFTVNNLSVIASETEPTTNYLPIILWTLYGLGVVLFSIRFFGNLASLITKIKRNPKLKHNRVTNVLINHDIIPHTFFNYIFLNKHRFEAKKIPPEVLVHEQAHAIQKHSLDILFIELIQIAFWFNPLIYLLKRAIKLNHEFLADQVVLNNGVAPTNYQNLLLAFSSNATPQLANPINYSFIKKRFTVMKTETSRRSALLRSIALLPLVTILILGFSTKEVIQKENQNVISEISPEKATPKQLMEYNQLAKKYNSMDPKNMFVQKKDVERLKYIYNLMTPRQRKNAEPFPKFPAPPPPKAPKPIKVTKGVNDLNPNTPPPPPKASKPPKTPKPPKTSDATNNWVYENEKNASPPRPSAPEEPLDHIIRMAKENTAFLYEGKRISSDMAIDLLKKNKSLNIETITFEKSNPVVKISKEGITIEK